MLRSSLKEQMHKYKCFITYYLLVIKYILYMCNCFLVNDQRDALIPFYVFIFLFITLYMFRAHCAHLRSCVLSRIILDISFVTPSGGSKSELRCLQGSDQYAPTKVSWLVTIIKRNLLVLYNYDNSQIK